MAEGNLLDRKSAVPLHLQFEEAVRQNIDEGFWPVGGAIPSENELARRYGISRMTARAVLTRLVDAGLLHRVPGKGTFVTQPKIMSRPLSQMGIREQLERMGYETQTILRSVEKRPASERIAGKLSIPRGELIYVVERLRSVMGEPLSIHKSYLPVRLCEGLEHLDLEGEQLCHILESHYHYEIIKRVETLESTVASPSEGELLGVNPLFPLLLFETVTYTCGGVPVECSKVLFRGDKIKLTLTYEKGEA